MKYSTPEKQGIYSKDIHRYLSILEKSRLAMHDLIIMRHGKIIFETYWKPFSEDFQHRMYSVSKSFVALAIGFLEQEGMLSLDDKISKYYAEELKEQKDLNMHNQTIRHMLMMSTAKVPEDWFKAKPDDRVKFYFKNPMSESRPSGTLFQYDSSGSFVLGALVEKITGMSLSDFLHDRLFKKIGVSEDVYCLKCPGNYSWGDSGFMCTAKDLLRVALFVLNKGSWNGEQILNEKFISDAVSCLIPTDYLNINEFETQGYGYLIWRTFDNSYFFRGMGCQIALCVPDKDIIMICNGDNQGRQFAMKTIIDKFFDIIVNNAKEEELPEEEIEKSKLDKYSSSLELLAAAGVKTASVVDSINNKTYILNENDMHISKIRFYFNEEGGILYYTNDQGDKELPFAMCKNEYTVFPQDGYADEMGTVPGNRRYKCASSAAWLDDTHLTIKVQIIDTYFGVLDMQFGFSGNTVGIYMTKIAEDFLDEYTGYAGGVCSEI